MPDYSLNKQFEDLVQKTLQKTEPQQEQPENETKQQQTTTKTTSCQ